MKHHVFKKRPRRSLGFAKILRKEMTSSEKILWKNLRAHRFHSFKIKRQVPIGSFIVDFACLNLKLIIEVDGDVHFFKKQYDLLRETILIEKGFTIIRFTNHQVNKKITWVLETIHESLRLLQANPLSQEGEG